MQCFLLDELVQHTLDMGVHPAGQRPSPEADACRRRPAATVPAAGQSAQPREAQTKAAGSGAGEPPAEPPLAVPHRCFPRPQRPVKRPAASCDSRTGRLARPASDWHVPRRWSHQPGDTEAECPAGALSICCRRRRLRGPSRRRREIRPNLSTQKLRPGESRHQVLPGEPIILD